MDLELNRFFPNYTFQTSTPHKRCFLFGPPKSGKSLLFFQYAISCARQNKKVLWILPKRPTGFPLLKEEPAMKNIILKYVMDSADLLIYLASFQSELAQQLQVDLLIVEDLSLHLILTDKKTVGFEYLKMLAFLSNTLDFLENQAKKSIPMLVSDTESFDLMNSYLPLIQNFLPCFLRIVDLGSQTNTRRFDLRSYEIYEDSRSVASYSFKLNFSLSRTFIHYLSVSAFPRTPLPEATSQIPTQKVDIANTSQNPNPSPQNVNTNITNPTTILNTDVHYEGSDDRRAESQEYEVVEME